MSESLRPARTLSSQFFNSELTDRPNPPSTKTSGQRVELLLVKVAHRPYGLLLSQVYNIVRPQNGEVRILRLPDPDSNRDWGEIVYQGTTLRVLELARMLDQPLVEPIDRSRILLTGKLRPNGTIDQPFGLAVDDILAVQAVSLNDVRLLPTWLCQKRLGRLVWAAALLDQTVLLQQSTARELQSQTMLAPLQLTDFMSEPVLFEDGPDDGLDLRGLMPVSQAHQLPPTSRSSLIENFPVAPKPAESLLRPVVLLDVSVLKSFAYAEPAAL